MSLQAQIGPMAASPSVGSTRKETKGVIIDCSHTRYHVVRAAARMIGWVVSDVDTEAAVPLSFYDVPLNSDPGDVASHPPQVIWTDKSVLSARVAGLECYQRLNHFASMNALARKAMLFSRLMQLCRLALKSEFATQDGHSFSARFPLYRYFVHSIPPSFSSIGDLGRLEAYQRQLSSAPEGERRPFFIIKPNTGCEGKGIRLSTSPLSDLTEAEQRDRKHECIVQLYIDRPLLMDGKKFDLRLYVLLVSVTPAQQPRKPIRREQVSGGLRAESSAATTAAVTPSFTEVPPGVEGVRLYVHREGLVRICAEPYATPTEANCTNALKHLTNYAVNRKSDLFTPAGMPAGDMEGARARSAVEDAAASNKRSLAALSAYIDGLHTSGGWARVQRRIDECITLTVLSGVEALRRELISAGGARGERADGRGCFELLGFDVMLREAALEPVLMEVNHSPSLFCDTAFDFAVKSAVLRDTFRVLEAHLPPWEAHEGNRRAYASYTCQESSSASEMDKAEEALLHGAEVPCGFRRLLPHYGNSSGDSTDDPCDWQQEERAAQECMVAMSRRLR
ncbi:hypothetical protein ABB37_04582 [Leptomonas pyrrhocoris]|uniref:Tubulin-tyrosine ligase-like protein n=1 Tax=Leptomonas pyrrhocoris TaxID=157538 RepID=A0A0N1J4U5_LEPPY|nr:hypothetical protein ABB37_04582 [Leptomonas pyrrhocoris]XP_015658733.1 hypothetical protein ABB37_04582 [Leptomonas pyrrhocoris]KPA80293.1 hypothetical protein ABB37_04582 [Leptomonas pyrrhocoris]KPA80294.1 hypothetical protein ABB37_04582 [Leptomonas pyrrhocoris]|eukprot:XP_015658732.1 hypothetical protein ABB37_04582 [Leptomonas pyrrhocoris]